MNIIMILMEVKINSFKNKTLKFKHVEIETDLIIFRRYFEK